MTITNNRILTPGIMGLDSLYLLIQTIIIFVFGSRSIVMMSSHLNYLLSIGLMILFLLLLFRLLFRGEGNNIYFLLLLGIILGTFFSSFTSFMQVLIDPNEFMVAQDRMFASVNNINSDLVYISIVLIMLVILYFLLLYKYLDVLALGKDDAINLGVPYDFVVKRLLIIVAIFISIATALIGSITFLGFLVVNISYEFLKTYRHLYLILGSVFISVIALIGGVYFIYLLLKENKTW